MHFIFSKNLFNRLVIVCSEYCFISINSSQPATNVEAFKKYVPSFYVKIIPDTGHVVFWDDPEMFNSYLEESIQDFKKDN